MTNNFLTLIHREQGLDHGQGRDQGKSHDWCDCQGQVRVIVGFMAGVRVGVMIRIRVSVKGRRFAKLVLTPTPNLRDEGQGWMVSYTGLGQFDNF